MKNIVLLSNNNNVTFFNFIAIKLKLLWIKFDQNSKESRAMHRSR